MNQVDSKEYLERTHRTCTDCGGFMSIDNFHKNKNCGHKTICKLCACKEQKRNYKSKKRVNDGKYVDEYRYPPIRKVEKQYWEKEKGFEICDLENRHITSTVFAN